jgi:hypothetical protein
MTHPVQSELSLMTVMGTTHFDDSGSDEIAQRYGSNQRNT